MSAKEFEGREMTKKQPMYQGRFWIPADVIEDEGGKRHQIEKEIVRMIQSAYGCKDVDCEIEDEPEGIFHGEPVHPLDWTQDPPRGGER